MKCSLPIYFMLTLSTIIIQAAANAQKVTPEIRFPQENHVNENIGPDAPATPWVDPPLLRPASPDPGELGRNRDSIADQLNRAELDRLLGASRGPRRALLR